MEVRTVQINGVKKSSDGQHEWVACHTLQIEFEMYVLNGSPTNHNGPLKITMNCVLALAGGAARLMCVPVCTLVIYSSNDCGDALRRDTQSFLQILHAVQSMQTHLLSSNAGWLAAWLTILCPTVDGMDVGGDDDHVIVSRNVPLRPIGRANRLLSAMSIRMHSVRMKKKSSLNFFFRSFSMMMSSSWCIYRTMLTLSTEACSKFSQTNLLQHLKNS